MFPLKNWLSQKCYTSIPKASYRFSQGKECWFIAKSIGINIIQKSPLKNSLTSISEKNTFSIHSDSLLDRIASSQSYIRNAMSQCSEKGLFKTFDDLSSKKCERVCYDGTRESGFFRNGVLLQGRRFCPHNSKHELAFEEGLFKNGVLEKGTRIRCKKFDLTFNKPVFEHGEFKNGRLVRGVQIAAGRAYSMEKGTFSNGKLTQADPLIFTDINGFLPHYHRSELVWVIYGRHMEDGSFKGTQITKNGVINTGIFHNLNLTQGECIVPQIMKLEGKFDGQGQLVYGKKHLAIARLFIQLTTKEEGCFENNQLINGKNDQELRAPFFQLTTKEEGCFENNRLMNGKKDQEIRTPFIQLPKKEEGCFENDQLIKGRKKHIMWKGSITINEEGTFKSNRLVEGKRFTKYLNPYLGTTEEVGVFHKKWLSVGQKQECCLTLGSSTPYKVEEKGVFNGRQLIEGNRRSHFADPVFGSVIKEENIEKKPAKGPFWKH